MSVGAANPERLLLALNHRVQLTIYGRGALWLGFEHPPAVAAATFDVDAIVPDTQVQALADDSTFWDARDAVNQRFKTEGQLIEAFSEMKPIGLVELRDAFARAKPVVLGLAR